MILIRSAHTHSRNVSQSCYASSLIITPFLAGMITSIIMRHSASLYISIPLFFTLFSLSLSLARTHTFTDVYYYCPPDTSLQQYMYTLALPNSLGIVGHVQHHARPKSINKYRGTTFFKHLFVSYNNIRGSRRT